MKRKVANFQMLVCVHMVASASGWASDRYRSSGLLPGLPGRWVDQRQGPRCGWTCDDVNKPQQDERGVVVLLSIHIGLGEYLASRL